MKIKNPNTGEIIEVPKGMEDQVRMAIEAGEDPTELMQMKHGGIHIKESKKGTFTAAAKKHGMGVQEFASKVLANKDKYSPAMVKKANFAKNATKFKHEHGGYMEFGGNLMTDYYYANGGEMIKRADGSYSKRGLWDNIRANAGSGKKPTKEMLKQEAHIRAMEKALGGEIGLYEQGGINNPGFRALPDYVQQNIIDNMGYGGYMEMGGMYNPEMAYGGYMATGGCMECGGRMESGGKIPTDVLRSRLEAHMSPDEVEDYLESYGLGGEIEEAGNGKWIQKAINPKHKGYCTPMTKATCTPKRKALAMTLKKMAKSRKKEEGGYVAGQEYEMTDDQIAKLRAMGYKISEL